MRIGLEVNPEPAVDHRRTTDPASGRKVDLNHAVLRRIHPLVLILVAGLLPRLLLLEYFQDRPIRIVDAISYDQLATSLVETGSYVDEQGQLTSLRPPLYPGVVAALYRIFGTGNIHAVRVFQILISLITTAVVYRIGLELYSRKVGVAAALIHCFYPTLLGFNNLILSEVTFTFFLSIAFLLATLVIKWESVTASILLGIMLGLGALTRSSLWLFSPLLAAFLFLACGPGIARRFRFSVIPLACFFLTVGPWIYRNTNVQETLTFIDAMGGRNVMMGNYEYTPLERSWATITTVTGDQAWHRVLAEAVPNYDDLTQGQKDKCAMRYGIGFFLDHPVLSVQRSLVKFFNFWQLDRTLVAGSMAGHFGELSKATVLVLATLVCAGYIFVMFGAVFGALTRPPSDVRLRWMQVITVAFPCLIHSIAFAHSRYHLPLIPILAVYTAAAVIHWRDVRPHRMLVGGVSVCVVLVVGWMREFIVVDLSHFS